MQSVCLVFAGRRGLDDQGVRHSILRIPEVSRRLSEAQKILDLSLKGSDAADIVSFIMSADKDFNLQQSLKSFVAAIVQIGLFDRFVKFHSRPQFVIGKLKGHSALQVCTGEKSFYDFVVQSDYFAEINDVTSIEDNTTQLAGFKLEEYGTFQWNQESGDYLKQNSESRDVAKIVEQLWQENQVQQCIHVGPYSDFRYQELERAGIEQVPSMNSIDLDPILSSFWKSA